MIATLTVTYQPGQLKAVAYRQGKPAGDSVLETTGPAVALRLEADRQSLSADTLDLCYVTATLVDEQGRRVYNDDRELSAFLRGPGTLAGFGSNNPCTDSSGARAPWPGSAPTTPAPRRATAPAGASPGMATPCWCSGRGTPPASWS